MGDRPGMWFGILFLGFLISCQHGTAPKPRGYFRIDLPAKSYHDLTYSLPVRFQVPEYAQVLPHQNNTLEAEGNSTLFDITFPDLNGTLHLTYLPVKGNLQQLINDAHEFVYKHTVKADAIGKTVYENPERRVYGTLFDIKGKTASAVQFYVTDSTRSFLRGSLYFNHEPNPDSLAPVIGFIREDVMILMESLEWLY